MLSAFAAVSTVILPVERGSRVKYTRSLLAPALNSATTQSDQRLFRVKLESWKGCSARAAYTGAHSIKVAHEEQDARAVLRTPHAGAATFFVAASP